MSHTTRESLLLRIHAGEPVAWDEFAARYRPLIAWFAGRAGLTGADTEDVCQEVLLDLFRGQSSFRYDRGRGRFRDYLYVITQRKTRAALARRGRSGVPVEDVDEPAADDPQRELWEAEWRRWVLREALEAVRGEVESSTFRAFEAFELEGQPVEQVAAELGIAPASVYVYKKRVLARLRVAVEGLTES